MKKALLIAVVAAVAVLVTYAVWRSTRPDDQAEPHAEGPEEATAAAHAENELEVPEEMLRDRRVELARLVLERKKLLAAERIAPQREVQEAQAEVSSAEAELRAVRATLQALGPSDQVRDGGGAAHFVLRSNCRDSADTIGGAGPVHHGFRNVIHDRESRHALADRARL